MRLRCLVALVAVSLMLWYGSALGGPRKDDGDPDILIPASPRGSIVDRQIQDSWSKPVVIDLGILRVVIMQREQDSKRDLLQWRLPAALGRSESRK